MWRPWEVDDVPVPCDISNTTTSPIGRGKPVRKQAAHIVLNVYKYFKEGDGKCDSPLARTVASTGVPRSTVKRIINLDINTYGTPTKKKKDEKKTVHEFHKVDGFMLDIIRRTVYEFYKNQTAPTIDKIYTAVREKTKNTQYKFPYEKTTLLKILKSMNFKFKKQNRRTPAMEAERIQIWRADYLNKIKHYRHLGYQDLYLDETWYDTHDGVFRRWTDETEYCDGQFSTGKGERVVILHIGGRNGFVPGAMFVTHKSMLDAPADYHGSMNAKLFEEWFEDTVRLLEEPSVIVMDNAKYHSRFLNPIPSSREEIMKFIGEHKISLPSPTPTTLLQLRRAIRPTYDNIKVHAVDAIATRYGHIVLRLPPYHSCLNPIEFVWSELKRKVSSENALGKKHVKEVRALIQNVIEDINSKNHWPNYIKHVEKTEDKYRALEGAQENTRIIINLQDSECPSTSEEEDN